MFLFLDVASPIPEFHIINDKKIIYSIQIIDKTNEKLSNKLIPTYLKLDKIYNLQENMKKLIITTGPASYTSLRVGASFISGLSLSMNLPVSVISNETIYKLINDPGKKIGIYFESSNNQIFFSYKKNSIFFNDRIENKNYIIPKFISFIYYNINLPEFKDKKFESAAFSIKNIIEKNLDFLIFNKNFIIKPIYISNNSTLN